MAGSCDESKDINKKHLGDIFVQSYVEAGFLSPPSIRLSDKDYATALQALVIACTDIVVVNQEKKVFYLAMRKIKPVPGIWWLGGRTLPGETGKSAAAHCLHRETSLDIDLQRFSLVASFDYLMKDREQEPQNISCHTRSRVFGVELSLEEIKFASSHLHADEYDKDFGLQEFDYDRLMRANVRPIIIDLYRNFFKSFN